MLSLVAKGIQDNDDDHDGACFLAIRKSWHMARVPVPCKTAAKAKAFMGALERKTKTVLTAATFNTLVNNHHQRRLENKAAGRRLIEPGHQKNETTDEAFIIESFDEDNLPTIAVTFARNLPLRNISYSVEVQQNTTDLNTYIEKLPTNQDERENKSILPIGESKKSDSNSELQNNALHLLPGEEVELSPNTSDEEATSLPPGEEVLLSIPTDDKAQTDILTPAPDDANTVIFNGTISTAKTMECFVPPPTKDEKMIYFMKETHSFLFAPVLVDNDYHVGIPRTDTTQGGENALISPFFHKVSAPQATRNAVSSKKQNHAATTIQPVAHAIHLLSSNTTGMRRLKRRLAEAQNTRRMAFSQHSAPSIASTAVIERESKTSYKEPPQNIASTTSGTDSTTPYNNNRIEKTAKSSNKNNPHAQLGVAHREDTDSTRSAMNSTVLLILLVALFVYKVRKFRTRNQYPSQAEASLQMPVLADPSSLIDEILVTSALQQGLTSRREPDLQERIVKEWSPLIPLIDPTSKHRHGCHFMIRKLTRLSTRGTSTDRLLGCVEEWMTSVLETVQLTNAVDKGYSTFSMMIKDLYLFLQVKYELPANAVITLLPFIIANASVEDLCCERRLGKMIFAAEAKLGDFFEEPQAQKNKPTPSLASKPHASVNGTKIYGPSSTTRPLVLEVTDVTDRDTIPAQTTASDCGSLFIKGKSMPKMSPKNKKEKLQAHKKSRRVSSPRSKEAFVNRAKYLQAVRFMRKKTQESKIIQ